MYSFDLKVIKAWFLFYFLIQLFTFFIRTSIPEVKTDMFAVENGSSNNNINSNESTNDKILAEESKQISHEDPHSDNDRTPSNTSDSSSDSDSSLSSLSDSERRNKKSRTSKYQDPPRPSSQNNNHSVKSSEKVRIIKSIIMIITFNIYNHQIITFWYLPKF